MAEAVLFEVFLFAMGVTIVVTLCHALKIPTLIGFVFTGIVLGPSGFSVISNLPSAYQLTELASILLMFTIGLEFSIDKLKTLRPIFIKLGLTQVCLTAAVVSVGALLFFDLTVERAIVWGMAISLSSTALVLKLLRDHMDMRALHGQNSIGILLFQDVAVIPMMLLLPALSALREQSSPQGFVMDWQRAGLGVLSLVAVALSVYALARWVLPHLLTFAAKTKSNEVFFFALVFSVLGFGELFHWSGLSMSLGAFCAGLILSESHFGHQTRSIFNALRDTLLGLFFATVGMLLELSYLAENLLDVIALGAGLFVLKGSLIYAVTRFSRFSAKISWRTAFTVCQVGEFSLVLVSQARGLDLFMNEDTQLFLSVSILSMIATPFLYLFPIKFIRWQAARGHRDGSHETKKPSLPEQEVLADRDADVCPHCIVVGYGVVGQSVVQALKSFEIPAVVIEGDYDVFKRHKSDSAGNLGCEFIYGDAESAEVLHEAGIETACLVVLSVSSSSQTEMILNRLRHFRTELPIIVRAQYVREVAKIKSDPNLSFVVAEIETISEMLAKVLKVYGLNRDQIYDFTLTAKENLFNEAEVTSGHRFVAENYLDWRSTATSRPYMVRSQDACVGLSLKELALPNRFQVVVVDVVREGVGGVPPTADLTILSKDVLQLVGDAPAVQKAIHALEFG